LASEAAIGPGGEVWARDYQHPQLNIYSKFGNLIGVVPTASEGDCQIASDKKNGDVVVLNLNTHAVSVHACKGKLMRTFVVPGALEFAVSKSLAYVLCKNGVNRPEVHVLDKQGQHISEWSCAGQGFSTGHIAINSQNEVYVLMLSVGVISNSAALQVYDSDGRLLRALSPSVCKKMKEATSISFDNYDNLLVTRALDNTVRVFSPNDEFLTRFTVNCGITGGLHALNTAFVGADNAIYVLEVVARGNKHTWEYWSNLHVCKFE